MIQTYRRAIWTAIATTAALGLPPTLAQAVEVTASNGWSASFDGNISAHLIAANASTLGGAPSDVRIRASLLDGIRASSMRTSRRLSSTAITVTGNFSTPRTSPVPTMMDLVHQRQPQPGCRRAGTGGRHQAAPSEPLAIGRGWGIFDSQAILNDVGSGIGTGELCGTPDNWNGGTCGRIGTGYHWTAFNSKIEYDTPDLEWLLGARRSV